MAIAKIRLPGDYIFDYCVIENHNGETYDITELLDAFVVNDDLFSNGSTAQIWVTDTMELFDSFNIKGGEKVLFSFYTDFNGLEPNKEFKYIKTLILKSIEELQSNEESNIISYKMMLVSEVFINNSYINIRKSYNNKTSNIVKEIHESISKTNLDIEETNKLYNITIPNWRPLKAIEMLEKRSRSDTTKKGETYLYYEDKRGHHFKCIESFLNKDIRQRYDKRMPGTPQAWDGFFSIENYNVSNITDQIDASLDGLFGSSLDVVDIKNRTFSNVVSNINNEYNKNDHLNNNKPYIPNVNITSKNDLRLVNDNNKQFNELSLNRTSKLNQFQSFILDIEVPGHSGLLLGDKIFIDLKSYFQYSVNNKDTQLNYLSGNYIIKTISHRITTKTFKTHLSLVKESYYAK